MEEPDDGQLLAAFRGGDGGAFELLVGRHQAALLRHARSLLGGRGAAEDVVQEVFLKLVQGPPELPAGLTGAAAGAHLASWLHKVTRNASMDVIRADSRRARRERDTAAAEATGGGIDAVEAADTRGAVERGIARLAGDQREVLLLRLLNGRSYREIADITGKKIGTVGWLVSTGLKALAADLEPLLTGASGVAQPLSDAQARRLQGDQA